MIARNSSIIQRRTLASALPKEARYSFICNISIRTHLIYQKAPRLPFTVLSHLSPIRSHTVRRPRSRRPSMQTILREMQHNILYPTVFQQSCRRILLLSCSRWRTGNTRFCLAANSGGQEPCNSTSLHIATNRKHVILPRHILQRTRITRFCPAAYCGELYC